MSLVSLDLIKLQIRLSGTDQDVLLQQYIDAAEAYCIAFLCRNVYATLAAEGDAVVAGTAGPNPMVVNNRILAAILLLVAGWYANREHIIVEQSNAIELPMGVTALLYPDRILGL